MSKGMRPKDVPGTFVEVATEAWVLNHGPDGWDSAVRAMLAAVLPLYGQQVRDQVAADLDAGIRDLEQRAEQAEELTSRTILLVQVEACRNLVAMTSTLAGENGETK